MPGGNNEGLYDSLKRLIDYEHQWTGRLEGRVACLEEETRKELLRHDTEDAIMFAKVDERIKKLELFNAKAFAIFGAAQIVLMLAIQMFAKWKGWI